ncbi:MAG: Ig-like domain repeat protein, partial [Elusimicrobiota bacterium]
MVKMNIKKLSTFILILILEFFITSLSDATVRKIRIVVDAVQGEQDITDNIRETEVNVVSQGSSDLTVTNISISPVTLTGPTTVSIFVTVKNKGNNIANNVNVYLSCLGRREVKGEITSIIIGTSTIYQILQGEEDNTEFKLWLPAPVNDGYNLKLTAEAEKVEGESNIWNNRYGAKFSITQVNNLIKILHETNVHQYVCVEAAKIYGNSLFGDDINVVEGINYLGEATQGTDPNPYSTICGGSYKIDHYNSVWPNLIFTPTNSHAWSADVGDDTDGFIAFTPNAWLHSKRLWGGWSTGDDGKSVVDYYASDKGEAYKNLGQIAHLMQDMGVPAHAHRDSHPQDIELLGVIIVELDDCFEDWMKDNHTNWGYQHAIDAGGLINIPWESRPSDISEEIFPLYYLMYTTNQYADHFASDNSDGDNYDRRGWVDSSSWGSPTTSGGLENNDWRWWSEFLGIAEDDDDNDDGDLGRIANRAFVYSIRATATLYKVFWETTHPPTPQCKIILPNGGELKKGIFKIYASASPSSECLNSDSVYACKSKIKAVEFQYSTDNGQIWKDIGVGTSTGTLFDNTDKWEIEFNSGVVNSSTTLVRARAQNYAEINSDWDTSDGVLTIDNTAPQVSNVLIQPGIFSPTVGNKTIINYTINDNLSLYASVDITVYNSQNELVKTFSTFGVGLPFENNVYSSMFSTDWDGKNDTGNIVSDGIYTVKIQVTDLAGNSSSVVSGNITVDNTSPTISYGSITILPAAHPSPNIFTLNDSTIQVRYNLADNYCSTAEIEISFNSTTKGTIFTKKITYSTTNIPQTITFNWDAKNKAGNFAPDGEYTVKLQVTDSAGNKTDLITVPQTFKIDRTPTYVTVLYTDRQLFIPEAP